MHQKTLSVPNLFNAAPSPPENATMNRMVMLPPPPPPPPPPPLMYHKPANHEEEKTNFQDSDSYDYNNDCEIDYEPSNDFDLDASSNTNERCEDYASHIEPAVDYDQDVTVVTKQAIMSTFNTNSPNSGKVVQTSQASKVMSLNSSINSSSPLTPRQIKQRNSAKRNSIPRSLSSHPSPTLSSVSLTNANVINSSSSNSSSSSSLNISHKVNLTPTQQRDLAFLQSQKFDSDFILTTRDLFNRYPNAKISISVTTTQTSGQNVQTTRQIEIDKFMFDKIGSSFQQAKIQPQTPIRTTSVLSNSTANLNSTGSSSSPGSVSSEKQETVEDLHEAIKRAAAEHQKRQSQNGTSSYRASNTPSLHNVSQIKSPISQSVAVKNELERAIENRMRRANGLKQLEEKEIEKEQPAVNRPFSLNKRNGPPPPLPLPLRNNQSSPCTNSPKSCSPPPLNNINSPTNALSNTSFSSFPPPPSPQALHRLSNPDSTASKAPPPPPPPPLPVSSIPPPPPPPMPSSLLTTTISTTTISSQINTNKSNNVRSIVNNYQQSQIQLLDPRLSSDFSSLIAKKAAEKRAKFTENKPSANAVTFQPDGSKVFTANSTPSSSIYANINNFNNTNQPSTSNNKLVNNKQSMAAVTISPNTSANNMNRLSNTQNIVGT